MSDLLVRAHVVLAGGVLIALASAALWGFVEFVRGGRFSRGYDRLFWVVQSLLLVQVAAGIGALLGGRNPDGPLHIIAGSAAALLPLLAWLLVRHRRRVSLDMGVAAVVMLAAGLLAVATGR